MSHEAQCPDFTNTQKVNVAYLEAIWAQRVFLVLYFFVYCNQRYDQLLATGTVPYLSPPLSLLFIAPCITCLGSCGAGTVLP